MELAPDRALFNLEPRIRETFEPLFLGRLEKTWPVAQAKLARVVREHPGLAVIGVWKQ